MVPIPEEDVVSISYGCLPRIPARVRSLREGSLRRKLRHFANCCTARALTSSLADSAGRSGISSRAALYARPWPEVARGPRASARKKLAAGVDRFLSVRGFGRKFDNPTHLALAFVHLAPINVGVRLPQLGHLFRELICERGFQYSCAREPVGQRSRVLSQHNGNALRWLHG